MFSLAIAFGKPRAVSTALSLVLTYLHQGFREWLKRLNKKMDEGEAVAFEANQTMLEQSAEYVDSSSSPCHDAHPFPFSVLHATDAQEKKLVNSFRYLY